MMTESEMFKLVKAEVKATGKLPKQKEYVVEGDYGETIFKFTKVTKKVNDKKFIAHHDYDPDFINRVEDNPWYGKTYYQINYRSKLPFMTSFSSSCTVVYVD